MLGVCWASSASGYKGQTFLLYRFYKIPPPLISEELIPCSECGRAPVKLLCVYTRPIKSVQTHYTKGEFPSELFALVLSVTVRFSLMGFTHTASTNSSNHHQKAPYKVFCVVKCTSLTDRIPFKSSSFKMIQMTCNVCVNIRSILRTYSTGAASENQSYIHESSKDLSRQSMILLDSIFTELLVIHCKLTTSKCFITQRIFQGGRLINKWMRTKAEHMFKISLLGLECQTLGFFVPGDVRGFASDAEEVQKAPTPINSSILSWECKLSFLLALPWPERGRGMLRRLLDPACRLTQNTGY